MTLENHHSVMQQGWILAVTGLPGINCATEALKEQPRMVLMDIQV